MTYYRELYLLENTKDKTIHFIYGFVVDCDAPVVNKPVQKISLKKKSGKSGFNILVKRDVLESDDILTSLRSTGVFQYKIYNCDITVSMCPRPKVLQSPGDFYSSQGVSDMFKPPESFSGELNIVESFWKLDKTEYLIDLIDNGENLPYEDFQTILQNLITRLYENTKLSFNGAYASRIGNYEYFSLPVKEDKFKIRFDKSDSELEIANQLIIESASGLFANSYTVNIVLDNNLDIILDKNYVIKEGEFSICAEAEEPISRYQVKIYNTEGDMIFQEGHILIRQVSIGMNIGGNNLIYNSTNSENILKRLNNNQKESVREKLSHVKKISHSRLSKVESFKDDPWNLSSRDIRLLVNDEIMQKDLNSWWFPTGAIEESECFLFLKDILGKTGNSKVFIVDPYFSLYSLETFLPVMVNQQAEYNIVTGLYGVDPDTNEISDNDKLKKKLIDVCKKNSEHLPAGLTIYNAAKPKKPLFHDRYIITISQSQELEVYSLSNSLNRAAGYYPLCITKLDKSTGKKISEYIGNLISGFYPDQNGNMVKYEPEIIWSPEKRKVSRTITKSYISDNGPEDYYCWNLFWGKLLGISDNSLLLEELIKREIILTENDKQVWNIRSVDILELIKNEIGNITFKGDELTSFIVGLGESLARTVCRDIDDLYSFINEKIEIFKPDLYLSVLKYYIDQNRPFQQNSNLAEKTVFASKVLDSRLIYNCKSLIDRPPFSFDSYWGFDKFMDQAMEVDFNGFINWGVSLEADSYQFISHLFVLARHGLLYKDHIISLLKSEKVVLNALAIAVMVKITNRDINNTEIKDISDVIGLLKDTGYSNSDILCVLSGEASGQMIGTQSQEDKLKDTEAYLNHLVPLYTEPLTEIERERLVSALERVEVIKIFIDLVSEAYSDRLKTLFLREAIITIFEKKLKVEFFYIGPDIKVLLDAVPEALIGINTGVSIDKIFFEQFQDHWDSLTAKLSLPYSYRDSDFWVRNMGISLFYQYIGHSLLIIDSSMNSTRNEDLEEYLWNKLILIMDSNLLNWPDYSNSEIVEKVFNLITYYYCQCFPNLIKAEEVIKNDKYSVYLKLSLIVNSDSLYSEFSNKIETLLLSSYESMISGNGLLTFIDAWIFMENKKSNSSFELIIKFIGKIKDVRNGEIPEEWFNYFLSIVEYKNSGKPITVNILDDEQFHGLHSYSIIKELD